MKRTAIRHLIVTFILVLSLTLGAGCTLLPEVDNSPPPSSPATENITAVDTEWSIPPAEGQAPKLPSIADVVAKVKPSVVAINTEVVTYTIFNQPFTQEGAGSGWIIDEKGYIVTNNHVVEGARNITVTLDDDRVFPAAIVGTDQLTDLAILKIEAENLTAARVGDSLKLRVGDWVVAIGNALGEGISATNGIVSRKEVNITVGSGQMLYNVIQTNAAINPGNSGGPLVNMAGEVIGINSVKAAAVEIEGVGYAISTSEAMPIIKELINTGSVIHSWLGVSLYSVNQYVVERFELTIDKGALVVEVAAGSPADKAGLETEDVIIGFAGEEIDTVDDLIIAIRSAQVGQRVEIIYRRGETDYATQATISERPPFP